MLLLRRIDLNTSRGHREKRMLKKAKSTNRFGLTRLLTTYLEKRPSYLTTNISTGETRAIGASALTYFEF